MAAEGSTGPTDRSTMAVASRAFLIRRTRAATITAWIGSTSGTATRNGNAKTATMIDAIEQPARETATTIDVIRRRATETAMTASGTAIARATTAGRRRA